MSTFSPITDPNVVAMLEDAVKLLRGKFPEEAFPVTKDDDQKNTTSGQYLCIEAKNIIIAVVSSDLWMALRRRNMNVELPAPETSPAGYRLSTVSWWPDSLDILAMEGVLGYAANKQADTVADLAFTKLMVC